MTLTFVVESMAAANAILRSKREKRWGETQNYECSNNEEDDSDSASSTPTKSLVNSIYYSMI